MFLLLLTRKEKIPLNPFFSQDKNFTKFKRKREVCMENSLGWSELVQLLKRSLFQIKLHQLEDQCLMLV